MKLMRWGLGLVLMFMVSACSGVFETPTPSPVPTEDSIAPSGSWSLEYTGVCEARESESLDITISDEGYIIFDDYTLMPDATGQYVGSSQFSTPMPADGRDVVFIITYRLTLESRTKFIGTETVEEVGKGQDPCPIQLVFQDKP